MRSEQPELVALLGSEHLAWAGFPVLPVAGSPGQFQVDLVSELSVLVSVSGQQPAVAVVSVSVWPGAGGTAPFALGTVAGEPTDLLLVPAMTGLLLG